LTNWTQEVLEEWDEFLREEDTPEGTKYSVYHATFREFLHRQDIVQVAGVTIEGITQHATRFTLRAEICYNKVVR
jgi:hypothetical protein